MNKKDIVRHKLVSRIVEAYERYEKDIQLEKEKNKKKINDNLNISTSYEPSIS